jgi:hypothetical protein
LINHLYQANIPSGVRARILAMSMLPDGNQVGEGRALVLASGPQPWYMTTAITAPDRRELEDERTRILAQAVGDHLPYELALRVAALAEQLRAA